MVVVQFTPYRARVLFRCLTCNILYVTGTISANVPPSQALIAYKKREDTWVQHRCTDNGVVGMAVLAGLATEEAWQLNKERLTKVNTNG